MQKEQQRDGQRAPHTEAVESKRKKQNVSTDNEGMPEIPTRNCSFLFQSKPQWHCGDGARQWKSNTDQKLEKLNGGRHNSRKLKESFQKRRPAWKEHLEGEERKLKKKKKLRREQRIKISKESDKF